MLNKNTILLCVIGSFFCNSPIETWAENQPMKSGVIGIWNHDTKNTSAYKTFRGASWIWMKESLNDLVLFRKDFNLTTVPQHALISISASDQYRLYVNGQYLNFGPARSASHHQSFDCLDIASFLHKGNNIIAIRALFNAGRTSYQQPERAGLLCSLSADGKQIMVSDDSWKVMADSSWINSGRTNNFQLFSNELVDFRKSMKGWTSLDFDDSLWYKPELLTRNEGWPTVQKDAPASFLVNPWTSLLKRDLPYLEENDVKAVNLLSCTVPTHRQLQTDRWSLSAGVDLNLVKNYDAYCKGKKALTVNIPGDNQSVVLVFDLQEMQTAMGKLIVSGEAGTKITVQYAPFVLEETLNKRVAKSNFEDEIILSGKGYDSWVGMSYKPIRYMALKIQGPASKVQIQWAGIHAFRYPFKQQGEIVAANDSWVADYMQATQRTISHCTTDAFTDNYREKRQYAQTGYYGSLGNYYTFADYSLQRRYLLHVAYEQNPNGIMPAYGPLSQGDYMVILDSNCLWLQGLYNYYLYSDDYVTTASLLTSAERLLDLLSSFTDPNGLIVEPPYAYWLDHANLDRRGANFLLNFHYYNALNDYAKLLRLFGKDAEPYQRLADKIKHSLLTLFWNEKRGLFVDAYVNGEQSTMFSEHTNGAALCLMENTDPRVQRVVQQIIEKPDQHNYITTANGLTMVTPAMSYFFHKGLCHQGLIEESFSMFRQRFDKMLNSGNHTLWEEWWLDGSGRSGKFMKMLTRSDAQTESAFFPALAAEFLVGFQPIEPGLKKGTLSYVKSGLKEVSAAIPSIYGKILIHKTMKTTNSGNFRVTIPKNVILVIQTATFPSALKIDGKRINKNEYTVPLKEGDHLIEF